MNEQKTCTWIPDGDGVYEAECGEGFVFECDGPKENHFKFCCFCGGVLIEEARND